jgi:cyclic beta-1,2-glucan synthetase
MYRAGIEWLLGFRLRGAALFIDPCIPRAWSGFSLRFRYHASRYEITVENPRGVSRGIERVEMDGVRVELGPSGLPLTADRGTHRVHVWMG